VRIGSENIGDEGRDILIGKEPSKPGSKKGRSIVGGVLGKNHFLDFALFAIFLEGDGVGIGADIVVAGNRDRILDMGDAGVFEPGSEGGVQNCFVVSREGFDLIGNVLEMSETEGTIANPGGKGGDFNVGELEVEG
jgi:hypothetical protein